MLATQSVAYFISLLYINKNNTQNNNINDANDMLGKHSAMQLLS